MKKILLSLLSKESKRLISIMWLIALGLGGAVYAATLHNPKVTPADNSSISSFNFRFQFDLTEISKDLGNDNIAVGYSGSSFNDNNTRLYEGTPEDGTLLNTTLTTNYYGSIDSKDYIDLSFSPEFLPVPGKTYTLVCNNSFVVYDMNTNAKISGILLDYQNEPLTLTFTGRLPSSSELVFQGTSLSTNEKVATVNSISYEFNENIAIAEDKPVQIFTAKDDLWASSSSLKIDPSNGKTLIVTFDDIMLYNGTSYKIKLPAGIVSLKSDPSVQNLPVVLTVSGSSRIRVKIRETNLETNALGLPVAAKAWLNLDEGTTLTTVYTGRYAYLYKDEISEGNLVTKVMDEQKDDAVTWSLSTLMLEPATNYILHKEADNIMIRANGTEASQYGHEELIFKFSTPSKEEVGLPSLEFNVAQTRPDNFGTFTDYTPDMAMPLLGNFVLELVEQHYKVEKKLYHLVHHPDAPECALYEIGDKGDRLIMNFHFDRGSREDKIRVWSTATKTFGINLYEGKKYKIVIPENYFTVFVPSQEVPIVHDYSLCNFVGHDEMTFTFTGTESPECVFLGCNVEDNSKHSNLYNIVWRFEGQYKVSDQNLKVSFQESSAPGSKAPMPLYYDVKVMYNSINKATAAMIDFVSTYTGEPKSLRNWYTYTITFPAGLLENVFDPDVKNDELVITLMGVDMDDAPESVEVNIKVEGVHTYIHNAQKGKDCSFTLSPAENWEVESVVHNDIPLTPTSINGENNTYTYTLSALNDNAYITANYSYAGDWAVKEETTGIWSVPETDIRIFKDANSIVVEGISPANTINVYTIGGMLVNTVRVSDGKDCVRINVNPGQFYIVTVDGVAAKLSM